MLDLDVGFIDSPMNIVQKLKHSKKDIFVQVRALVLLAPCNLLFARSHSALYNKLVSERDFVGNILLFIASQQDLAFIMNRSLAGWRTWYTEPMPNIGKRQERKHCTCW